MKIKAGSLNTTNPSRRIFPIATMVLMLGASGCATIPKESAELADNLRSQISDMRDKHIALVNQYFAEVESRIQQTYLVDYKNQLVGKMTKIEQDKGLTLTMDQYDKITAKVLAHLSDAMSVLSAQKANLIQAINDQYVDMNSESQALETLLTSASKIDEMRQRYTGDLEKKGEQGLKALDDTQKVVGQYMDQAKGVVDELKKSATDTEDLLHDTPR